MASSSEVRLTTSSGQGGILACALMLDGLLVAFVSGRTDHGDGIQTQTKTLEEFIMTTTPYSCCECALSGLHLSMKR